MKLPKDFEISIFVLIVLATQINHTSIKSTRLSELLLISDSSLKKTLRKLVVAKLIESNASKDGGYTLLKRADEIALADILLAIEDTPVIQFTPSNLANKVFQNQNHINESKKFISQVLLSAEKNYIQTLGNVFLSELLEADAFQAGKVEWH
ncbi:Rrf2 family transcriptional regulator [Weissella diestrammenae]|uniref:Rrf2 family transcriptional regulator n=1 Tax=Weissella diestrammenae TaxID=1162633 RepID=A0A7G9T595_9LACO|nr:Rrf2 family transcriptional regulator [Weissella diestrammenae]MCM0583127.1 Rrf2 family transcriptional regulator [Weissella diestrammenae]QNN75270.1 Rrf2 family transcriptional regulator [Weissella diestrammenae]